MIYQNQSVELRLNTGIDLSGAAGQVIKYQKPDGDEGQWPATIEGSELVYETANDDFDEVGIWKLQSFLTISGNNKFGRIARQTINKRL